MKIFKKKYFNRLLSFIYPSEMKMQQGASERRVYKREAHTQATSNDAASSFPMGIVPIVIFFLFSCYPEQKTNIFVSGLRCKTTTNLQYSDTNCSTTDGCTLIFSCPSLVDLTLSSDNSLSPHDLTTEFTTTETTPLVISSITTVDTPALLQTTPGPIPQNWYSNATGPVTLNCTNDNGQISCAQFAPVGSQFTIIGRLGSIDITVQVKVKNKITPVASATDLTTGCGQFGTTYQRIFDCSERVKNFAGVGSYGKPSKFHNNPNANWYLVACPVFTGAMVVGTDTTVQQCAWISPVIEAGNPVIGINSNNLATSMTDPTSPNFVSGITRILWSGSLDNSNTNNYLNFGKVVGTDNTSTDSGGPYANCTSAQYNPGENVEGKCANYNLGSKTSPNKFNDMISVSDSATKTLGIISSCATQLMANDNAFSGMRATPYNWQVPSYPMLMTLTGGQYNCNLSKKTNASCNAAGFSAISTPVPAFDNTTNASTYLWSSSMNGAGHAWEFGGYGGFGYVDYSTLSDDPRAVRCVSIAW